MRKPMNIISNDNYYGDFLLSMQQHCKDLEEKKLIPMEDVKEVIEPFYRSVAVEALRGYRKWIHSNSTKIARDIKKVLKHGTKVIRAPENERKIIEFEKYVKAIKGLCILPSDVDDIVKARAIEVANAMYEATQAKKKLRAIKAYMKKNYKAIKEEVEKLMTNKETSGSSSSSASGTSSEEES